MISIQEHNNILLEFRVQNKQLMGDNAHYREALEEILTTELLGIPIEKHINLLRKMANEALEGESE